MPLNKLQIKAKVFEIINPLRDLEAIDDKIISKAIKEIKAIKEADFEFIARILIKEADVKTTKSAGAFLYMAENLAPESFIELILKELNSNKIPDSRKMFFLNILSGLGIKFNADDINSYLKNPDEAINKETSRFLECAKIDPEAQIDFLDFYFSSDALDKKELINSVIKDFEGDRLINILSPLALSADDKEAIELCLNIMEKQKSLISIKPLNYLSNLKTSAKIQNKAFKILQKMKMSGFYSESKLYNFYKTLLRDFEEPKAAITTPDGNSNFSVLISRKTRQGSCFLFFVAINIELGPFSCFGFSSLTENDHDTIIKRFFNSRERFFIPIEEAKAILNTLTLRRISLNKIIPYEYFCWERLLDDVEPKDGELFQILEKDLTKKELTSEVQNLINNSPYFENWFFRYSKNIPWFSKMMDKILELKDEELYKINGLIEEYSKNEDLKEAIKKRLKFLAYCLNKNNKKELADTYYSLIFNEKELKTFLENILKRSVYEFALTLNLPRKEEAGLFKKPENKKDNKKAKLIIDFVEKEWIDKNGN